MFNKMTVLSKLKMLIKSNKDIESNNSFTSNSLQISFTRIRSLYCWSIFFRFLMYSGSVPSSSCCNCFFKWANLSWYILQEVQHFTKFKNSIQFSSHAALNCINWNIIYFFNFICISPNVKSFLFYTLSWVQRSWLMYKYMK